MISSQSSRVLSQLVHVGFPNEGPGSSIANKKQEYGYNLNLKPTSTAKPSIRAFYSPMTGSETVYILPSNYKYNHDKVSLLNKSLELIAVYLDKHGNTENTISQLLQLILESVKYQTEEIPGFGKDIELRNSIFLLSQKRGVFQNDGLIRGIQKLIAFVYVLAMNQKKMLKYAFTEKGELKPESLKHWLKTNQHIGRIFIVNNYVRNMKLILESDGSYVVKFGKTYNNTIALNGGSFTLKENSIYERKKTLASPNDVHGLERITPNSNVTKKAYFRDYAENLFTFLNKKSKPEDPRHILTAILNASSSNPVLANYNIPEELKQSLSELSKNRGLSGREVTRGIQYAIALFYIVSVGAKTAFDETGLFDYNKFYNWCETIEIDGGDGNSGNDFLTSKLEKRYFRDICLPNENNGLSVINFGHGYDVSIEVINPKNIVKAGLLNDIGYLMLGASYVDGGQPDWTNLKTIETDVIRLMGMLGYPERKYTIENARHTDDPDDQLFLALAINLLMARVAMVHYSTGVSATRQLFKSMVEQNAESDKTWQFLKEKLADFINDDQIGCNLSHFIFGDVDSKGDMHKFMASKSVLPMLWDYYNTKDTWLLKNSKNGIFLGNNVPEEKVVAYLNNMEYTLRMISKETNLFAKASGDKQIFYCILNGVEICLNLDARPPTAMEMRGEAFIRAKDIYFTENPAANLFDFFTSQSVPSIGGLIASNFNLSACGLFVFGEGRSDDERLYDLVNYLMFVRFLMVILSQDINFADCKNMYLDFLKNAIKSGLIPFDNMEIGSWKEFLIKHYIEGDSNNLEQKSNKRSQKASAPGQAVLFIEERITAELNAAIITGFATIYKNLSEPQKKDFIKEIYPEIKGDVDKLNKQMPRIELEPLNDALPIEKKVSFIKDLCNDLKIAGAGKGLNAVMNSILQTVDSITQDAAKADFIKDMYKEIENEVKNLNNTFKIQLRRIDDVYEIVKCGVSVNDGVDEVKLPDKSIEKLNSLCDVFFDVDSLNPMQLDIITNQYFNTGEFKNIVIKNLLFAVKDNYAINGFTYNKDNISILRRYILGHDILKKEENSEIATRVETYVDYMLQATYCRTIKPVATPYFKSSALKNFSAHCFDEMNNPDGKTRESVAGELVKAFQKIKDLNIAQDTFIDKKPNSYYYALALICFGQNMECLFQQEHPLAFCNDIFREWLLHHKVPFDAGFDISKHITITFMGSGQIKIHFKSTHSTNYNQNDVIFASLDAIVCEAKDNFTGPRENNSDIHWLVSNILDEYFDIKLPFRVNEKIGSLDSSFYGYNKYTLYDLPTKQKLYNKIFEIIKIDNYSLDAIVNQGKEISLIVHADSGEFDDEKWSD